jgi:hypothetical protein
MTSTYSQKLLNDCWPKYSKLTDPETVKFDVVSSDIASKTEVGGTIYGSIKKLVGGPVRTVNAEGM